jgi:integrase
MRGHLVKRGKGSWSVVLDLPRENGKRKQQWVSVKGTRKDAERRLTELLGRVDTGIPIDNSKLTLSQYLDTWLRDVVAVRVRPRTADSYGVIVRRHTTPTLGGLLLRNVRPGDVERMEAGLISQGLSANTARHVHVVLSKALKDAMKKGLVHRNVCQAVETPRVGQYEVQIPDNHQDIGRVLHLARETPFGALLHFIAFTGVRRGEALALRWHNLDLERGVAAITETVQRLTGKGVVFQPTKSASGRRGVALDARTVSILREHRGKQLLHKVELEGVYQDQGLVFPSPLGTPLDPGLLTKHWIRLVRGAGLRGLRLHDLRHAHAAGLIRANAHPKVVQERLGHSSAAFTMQVYGHVAAGLQQEAATAFANLMANSSG